MITNDTLNGTVVRGDDIFLDVTVLDEDGALVPLSGLQAATFKMKLTINGDYVLQKTLGAGVSVSDLVNSIITVSLTNAESALFKTKTHIWEIEIVDLSGKVSTIRNHDVSPGQLTIEADL